MNNAIDEEKADAVEMTTYLSNYREDTPEWIKRYLRGEKITFKDFMSSRVGYYPGSGYDGTLMKVCNISHSVHSFLYVDYMLDKKDLERHLAAPKSIIGYHSVGRIEWTEADLFPQGIHPFVLPKKPCCFSPQLFTLSEEHPYCFTLIMERNKNYGDAKGAKHFAITFYYTDGIEVYYQLFVKEYAKAPWIVLLQDHILGGNYDRFGRGGNLDAIMKLYNLYPEFVICGDNTSIWQGYQKAKAKPVYGGLHNNRRSLFRLP